jgi:hypothetical protein
MGMDTAEKDRIWRRGRGRDPGQANDSNAVGIHASSSQ